jgi:cytochrome c oxidase cbb3-type subunit III
MSRTTNMLFRFLFIMLIASTPVFGQTAGALVDVLQVFTVGVIIFFILVLLVLLALVLYHGFIESGTPYALKLWQQVSQKLTSATPVDQEDSIVLEHEFDGIKELDNVLPPWWKYLFYASIVFAVVYLLDYHVLNLSPTSEAEYRGEIQAAELQRAELMGSGAFISEKTVTLLTDPAAISSGSEIFKKNCVACHGIKAEGLVGPNLTDDFWIHGGGVKNIFRTVTNGVPEKGMLSWKTQLKPKEIQEVASYVISLHGSNPPNAKPPQGTKWSETSDSTKSAPGDTKL